jgi:type IV pilus assembly protein PilY1
MKKMAFLFILTFSWLLSSADAAMNDYCVTPVSSSIVTKPNILILMDYSGSMQFPAYVTCDYDSGIYDGKVVNCQTPSSSASDNYNSTKAYYGLFDMTMYYRYSAGKFQVNTSCTNTDKIGNSNTCISGNLLNWITSTRIDVSRKVLTGGRTNTGASDIYQSEGARLVYTDTGLHCKFTITTTSTNGSGATKARTVKIENQTGLTCPLGTLSASDIDIQPVDPSADTGITQDFYNKATFEFMIFNSDYPGKLLSAKDSTESSLIAAMTNEQPYNGTPTGEGLREAQDFFKQSNDYNYQSNTSDLSRGNGVKDPWYDGSGSGSKAITCRKSFVVLISDGAWNGSVDPASVARTMRTADQRSDLTGSQTVTTYSVYAFGDKDPTTKLQGQRAMITTAILGGFDDYDSNAYPYPFSSTNLPGDSRFVAYPLSQCDPANTWDANCKEWDKSRTGLPYNYFEADDGEALKTSLMNALNDILRRASSGTAASVLASSEGSGANILQSVFYPKRLFNDTEISWIGEMQNLWYYVDPYLLYSSIREDTNTGGTGGTNVLNLGDDNAIEFFFDTDENKTRVRRYSTNSDGSGKTLVGTAALEDIKNLWEAGSLLFQRTSARTIYTTTDGVNFLTGGFSTGNSSTLAPYLQATDATKIIDWVHGSEQTGCRSRTVTISGTTGVWKLGDIVSSTPKIQSSVPLNTYHSYPPDGYLDSTYLEFIQDASYKSRGMSYVGGNDGMLHAFKFGNLQQTWTEKGTNDKARLYNADSTPLGFEMWSFIPKNALPYLKYLADPNYCHVNLVDLPSSIVDVSIANSSGAVSSDQGITKTQSSWRTVLIGGMGLGGANKNSSDSCTTGDNGTCVKTPIADVGYSSYFAIDVTDPTSPQLLWEFSDPALGFSTSGPAIVRIGAPDKNGKWFAVFASGPTGPINTTYHQFIGTSNQNLKLFAVDIATGSVTTIDTGVENAFGGSLYNSTIDVDRGNASSSGRYSDDAFYLGYTRKNTSVSPATWTKGGVLRVLTKEDQTPSNWVVRHVISDTNAVTASVTKLQNRRTGKLWLFFGTGRFFYKYEGVIDDASTQQQLYGVTDPCYDASSNTMNKDCTSSGDVRWTINDLDAASGEKGAERVITDPLAVYSGAVFFTTYAPSKDVCSMGGDTYVWAVKYDSGGTAWQTGKAVTQVSTGAIQELDLSSVFTEKSGRRTSAIIGMPPKGQGLSVLLPPRPLKKFLHIRQK